MLCCSTRNIQILILCCSTRNIQIFKHSIFARHRCNFYDFLSNATEKWLIKKYKPALALIFKIVLKLNRLLSDFTEC